MNINRLHYLSCDLSCTQKKNSYFGAYSNSAQLLRAFAKIETYNNKYPHRSQIRRGLHPIIIQEFKNSKKRFLQNEIIQKLK